MFHRNTVVLVIASLFAATVGCTHSNQQTAGENMADSFQHTKFALSQTQAQVDDTLMRMDQFKFTGILSDQFRAYKSSVDQLQKQGDDARKRAHAFKDNYETYQMDWSAEMKKTDDPAMKANLQARQDAVKSNLGLIRDTAQTVRAAYDKFLNDNQEIVQTLSLNLSPAAVASLKPTMDRAHADGAALKQQITGMQTLMTNIENGVAPAATK